MVLVLAGTIQGEVFLLNTVVFARFHPENKLAVHKPLTIFIQQHRVDSISERITHAGRDKYVFVSLNFPLPRFLKSALPILTVVTYRSGRPSLSISAKEAPTQTRSSSPTPAEAVMFSNLPWPRFRQS